MIKCVPSNTITIQRQSSPRKQPHNGNAARGARNVRRNPLFSQQLRQRWCDSVGDVTTGLLWTVESAPCKSTSFSWFFQFVYFMVLLPHPGWSVKYANICGLPINLFVYLYFVFLIYLLVPGRAVPSAKAAPFARAIGVGGVGFTAMSRRYGAQNQ